MLVATKLNMLRRIQQLIWLTLLWLSTSANASPESDTVVVSIPPLALIAKAIYGEEAHIDVLLRGSASPHHSALRPSDMRSLSQAKAIFWVGPTLENYLVKALQKKPHTALMPALGPDLSDPHIWLNLHLASKIASIMAKQRIAAQPSEKSAVLARLSAFNQQLDTLEKSLQQTFQGIAPFVVFHDSLNYWVEHYQLPQIAALTDVPEESIGLKTLATLAANSQNAQCMLTEPGELNDASKYAQRLKLPLVAVDILGTQRPYPSYTAFITEIANSVTQCASSNKQSIPTKK